ncbi:HIRAN domain-containing protein [Anaerosphaera multitolerans]|uniref:HIRAN domain-containing protein n=1 Tax=Anaerosphaera multitolerans TaxID=2487351 RepID=UPI00196A9AE2|nr:HIRAN domain-containing protein [Anaerosphaera multitolerans]
MEELYEEIYEDLYVTLTGLKHYEASKLLEIGMKLIGIKDYKNKYDQDAIVVVNEDMYIVGYVANSPYTVIKGTKSAGRIYDYLNLGGYLEVMFITKDSAICKVLSSDISDVLDFLDSTTMENIFNEFNIDD